ncbi:DUF3078 domain-containing protein [Pseudochryseolinea flava]|uniref:DUF3078 domain-containing protein n=1 Tax=Pseudochryseolinea flava TaxID=2059302 RepID=A0A364Y4H7_9BACT|nr:DUF3078 domain-containing protein [Pseudochryseolinea flava]RAW01068.1 hypothetical protein DQQ10_12630 [Pseudochryseolinea flava]
MKKTSYFIIFLLCIGSFASVQAQIVKPDTTTSWKRKFVFNFNVNQASFSSNWSAGGINSLGFASLVNYKLNYKKNRDSWDNEIDLLYGFVNNAGQGFRKTTDRIYLDTKYGYQLSDKWDLFSSINFLSQFSPGYKYEDDAAGVEQEFLISDFLAPAFVTGAIGFEYHPKDYFKVRISPFAPRLTIVNDPERFYPTLGPNPYGLDSAETTRFEWFAFQLLAEFNKDIMQNVNLKWRYMMYANYEDFAVKKIDHRLDVNLTAKVNRFITVGLGGILVYDFDQDDEVQLSQALTIGFAYSFQNFEDPK